VQAVALFCGDLRLRAVLQDLHRRQGLLENLLLHPASDDADSGKVFEALKHLNFAGALILDDKIQREAFGYAARSSLDAQEVGAADALAVTAAGLVGDYGFGRAVGQALAASGWDARGAAAVILGSGIRARAISRDLASLGVRQLAVLARNRPLAEETTRQLAASTEIIAKARDDALTLSLIERADLLVRIESKEVPHELLGPHLTIVDLVGGGMTPLRHRAMAFGALTLNLRDVQAEQLALALGHLLEARLEAKLFRDLIHDI
jgi:shikimate 5-dehydrogenase